jgi:DNA-directed RNA polymerase subunit L
MKISTFDIKRLTIHDSILKRYPHHDARIAPAEISFQVEGVPIEVANAFRRVMLDELPGYSLTVDNPFNCVTKHKDTDLMMIDNFIAINIRMIPLRYHIPSKYKDLKWSLRVENNSPLEKEVFSGDLKLVSGKLGDELLFDQNIMLGVLQPYKFIEVKNIFIIEGIGREHASFQNVHRSVCLPLDIEEYPEEDTHIRGGSQVDYSGYKESSLVADPQKFQLSGIVNATLEKNNKEIKLIPTHVCQTIISRIKTIESGINTGADINVDLTVSKTLEANEAILNLHYENQTISYLIQRYVNDLYPLEAKTSVTITSVYIPHEFLVEIRVKSTSHDVKEVIMNALHEITRVFETLKKQAEKLQ